jgi:CheY-like chemotaxis protein/two-component sensor histidine kinase
VASFKDVTELVDKEKRLEAALKHRDAFLAVLGHEMRNPLAAISLSVDALRVLAQEGGSAAALDAVTVLEHQVKHCRRLLNDMLDTDRISRGVLKVDVSPLDVTTLAKQVVQDHQAMSREHGLRLEFAAGGPAVWVAGDAERLTQVLANLISNSCKFTPPSGLITVAVYSGPGGNVTVSVEDTGPGVLPEDLPHLFNAYWQSETRRTGAGLGLGLTLCKGIVEAHGGTIRAESEGVGKGLRVSVQLPRAKRGPAGGDAAEQRSGRGLPAHKVLLVEDNPMVSSAMRILMEFLGQEVKTAEDGPGALHAAREFQPDLVFCDISLPGGMDGYAVVRAFRNGEIGKVKRLIALTGLAGPEVESLAKEAGFDMLITKPIDPQHLRSILAEEL